MARLPSNEVLSKLSGQLGRQIVVKQYKNKTIVTSYPDMSRVKPSAKQKAKRNIFKDAVAYARGINRDPVLKKEYLQKVEEGESVYHYALKEYLREKK